MKVVNIKQEGIKTFFVTWTIHDYCNFRCSYCPAGLNEGKRRQVTFEHVKKLFTVLKSKLEPDRKIIFAFSGGEPTLHPEFLEIVKYLYDNGVEVTMTTNGGKGVEWWREIEPYIAHMVISYHPEFSKFDKILEKVEFLHEHCWVNIDMMMDPKHWDEQMAYTEKFKQFEKNITPTIPYRNISFFCGNKNLQSVIRQISCLQGYASPLCRPSSKQHKSNPWWK